MARDFSAQEGILRQADIRRYPINIVGIGGIGSWLTLMLAWEGYRPITAWDPDTVGSENATQAYWVTDIGRPKGAALAAFIQTALGLDLTVHERKFTEADDPHGVVIAAVDSMAERQVIWRRAKRNPAIRLFVDTRMGREVGMIYTIDPMNPLEVDYYEERSYSDEQAAEIRCNERSVVHNLWTIGAYVGYQLKCFLQGAEVAQEIHFDLSTRSLVMRNYRGHVLARIAHPLEG